MDGSMFNDRCTVIPKWVVDNVFKIRGRFPEKEKNPSTGTVSLPGKELADIIERTTYATSKDDLKPALTGVYFNIKKGERWNPYPHYQGRCPTSNQGYNT